MILFIVKNGFTNCQNVHSYRTQKYAPPAL